MKYCIKCGHQLDDEDIFCDKCGEPADSSKTDSTPAEENIKSDNYSPKKKNRFIKIFAALSAAVVVCIGGYLLIDWIQIEINAKKINDLYEETRQQMQTEATSIVTNVQTEPVSIAPAKTTSAKTTAIQETTKATEKKPEVHYSLYTAILNELTLGYSYYDLSNCYYTLYDINGDGIYELIINFSDGSVESSFMIYTIKDNEVKYIDEIPSFSSSLSEKDKKLYLHYGHSGYQIVKRIDFDGSNISETTVSEENNVSDYTVYGYALQGSRLSDTARIKALYSKEELNNMPNIKVKLTDERLPQGIGVFLNVSGNYDYYEYICFEYNFSGGEPYLNNGSSSEKQLKISAFSANVSKVVVVVTPYSSNGIAGETVTADYVPVYESSVSPRFSSADASSILAPVYSDNTKYSYYANNVLDGNLSTCWCEGKENNGENEYITLRANSKQQLKEIDIYNGLYKDEELFYKNCRVKKCRIEFSDGTSMETTLDGEYKNQPCKIRLDNFAETDFIKITILSTYSGNKYSDTCISEIEVK